MQEVNDYGLTQEILDARALLVVAFIDRLDAGHRSFVRDLEGVASRYKGSVNFRMVDVSENPSLVAELRLRSTPATALFVHGMECGRWQGRFDMERFSSALGIILKSRERSG